ncbi:MAG: hypothetical protein ACLGG0_15450 [Bacteriovoracia bacterium]
MNTTLKQKIDRCKDFCAQLNLTKALRWVMACAALIDIFSCFFLMIWLKQNYFFERMLTQYLAIQQIAITEIEPVFVKELIGTLENAAGIAMLGFLLINFVFYFYCYYQKRWASQYVRFYLLTGSLMSLSFLISPNGISPLWLMGNVVAVILYAALGLFIHVRWEEFNRNGWRLS